MKKYIIFYLLFSANFFYGAEQGSLICSITNVAADLKIDVVYGKDFGFSYEEVGRIVQYQASYINDLSRNGLLAKRFNGLSSNGLGIKEDLESAINEILETLWCIYPDERCENRLWFKMWEKHSCLKDFVENAKSEIQEEFNGLSESEKDRFYERQYFLQNRDRYKSSDPVASYIDALGKSDFPDCELMRDLEQANTLPIFSRS